MNCFVVSNGLNTSYIDSVLMALFYSQSHLKMFLNQYPENSKFIYLQELINDNFVENVRQGYSIESSILNEIRNYSIICGWKNDSHITDLHNVSDYMKFLMEGIGFGQINFETVEYDQMEHEIIKTLSMSHIEIKLNENSDIKQLLDEWYDNNFISKTQTFGNRFREIPLFIPIYFSRQSGSFVQIDIKKRIKFKKNSDPIQNKSSWIIHSIICFSNSGGGGYYTIINMGNYKWSIFSNDKLPSLIEISLNDPNIASKIKQECVMIIYRLD